MKTILFFLASLFISVSAFSQFNNVGIGTTLPDNSAVLDITAQDKGVLLPRMDSTHRKNIASPKDGLILYDSTTYSFWFYRDTEWKEFHWEEGAFENNAGVVRNTGSNSDDFVFGAAALPPNGINTTDTLFFFDKSKVAFRYGLLDNSDKWSTDSIGLSSWAFGLNPLAKGDGSISLGFQTQARGTLSMAQGSGTIANAQHSIAMGYQSQANGNSAVALGNSNIALGNESFAAGIYSEANGTSSTAIGYRAISDAYGSMAIGRFNEGGGDPTNWVVTDPIFEVGIGQDPMNKKNALTIKKDGAISFKNYSFPNGDGSNNQVIQTDGSGNLSWTDQTPEIFENVAGVVSHTGSNNDDFVFGASSLPPNGTLISGTLFFFDDSKGAFRAGELVNSENWSPASMGLRSAAFGQNTIASGLNSTATGNKSEATGNNSLASGDRTEASGIGSFAMGRLTTASGNFSTSLGDNTQATGNGSIALGLSTTAFGSNSTAMGSSTYASGSNAAAMGENTIASGDNATAMGENTTASGDNATSIGVNTDAAGTNSTAMGSSTLASGLGSVAMGLSTEASGSYSVALGSGSEAIGNYSVAMGNSNQSTATFSVTMGNGNEATSENAVAMGLTTISSGLAALATGFGSQAAGDYSTAMGSFNIANGDNSFAVGHSSFADGLNSIAMGTASDATGDYSIAIGEGLDADAINAFVIGRNNVGGGNSSTWISTDPIFEVGIGSSGSSENALTIYKNGNAEINGELMIGFNTFESISNSFLTLDASFLPSNDDAFDIGSPASRWDNIYATNGVIQTSDRRLKKNIAPLSYGLATVLNLNPVQYNWKKEKDEEKQHVGLIAQEILALVPEVVNQGDSEEAYLGVKYAELVPVLIKAIQEQNELIHSQEKTITGIQKEVVELKEMISALVRE